MNADFREYKVEGKVSSRHVIMMGGRSRFVPAVVALLFLGAAVHPAIAQSYLTSTGAPSFAAPEPVELGFVDASNGNLHLSIPLGSYPQRATSQPEVISLEYDSSIWTPYVSGFTTEWEPNNGPGNHSIAGWYYSFEASAQSPTQVSQGCWTDQTWADQNGTAHIFHLNLNYVGGQGCPTTADAFATDSSGYHMYSTATDLQVYAPDGTLAYSQTMTDPQGRIIIAKDSNGNFMSITHGIGSCPASVYDTLGRQVATASTLCGPASATVTTSQGTAQYTLSYATINVKTNFQQSGVQETSTQIMVIRSLTLPDAAHSTYYFTYDCDSSTNAACGSNPGQTAYYGELTGITLPTGGQVSYFYGTFKDAYSNMSRWVNERVSGGASWTYAPAVLSACSPTQVNCKQQTTISSPTGAQKVYTFQLNNGAWPTSIVQKDTSGNPLTTIANTWDMTQSCVPIGCHGASYIRLLTQQTTVYTPGGGSLIKQVSYTYDSPQTGNQTAIKEWGYTLNGNFSSVPDRATYVSYLTTGTNDINRPLTVTLCNSSGSDTACLGGGAKVSQTLYTYDSYGYNSTGGASGLTTVAGMAQHDDTNFGLPYSMRGNVTSESRWVSGSNYLTTSYTYDTTGQVLKETDPVGNKTTYGYADSFFTDGGNNTTPITYAPSQSTNAYLTSETDAIGTQKIGYYWGSGKPSITTDYNSISTYNHFQDGLDRQTEETDPVGWSLATYSSATQSDMYAAVGDVSPSASCISCQHTQTVLDSLGRTASQILVNNPIGQVNLDSTYDGEGRLNTQSHPYSGSGDPNHVFETFGYDELGRQLSTTHPDGQSVQAAFGANVSGLGGLTSQQGSATTYGYGYPQISADESGHQRQHWMDGFGRIIEADEPTTSAGSNATATVSVGENTNQEFYTYNPCPTGQCPTTVANWGWVYLTVGSYTASTEYQPTNTQTQTYETADQVATALAGVFNGDPNSPVTASASGTSILLTAKGPGTSGNLAFSSSETWNTSTCGSSPCFAGSAFNISPSSGSLTGGSGGSGSSPYYTNYTYDAADHLVGVYQGVQSRLFAYDGLGRKISETTPEGGTVTFSYASSGGGLCSGDPSSVCQRTDARGVVSTYTYDNANRLTGVTYTIPSGVSAMPNVCTTAPNGTSANVCYFYDQGGAAAYALGRQTEMIDPSGSETTIYYSDGHVKQTSKVVGGQTYTIGYQYDAGGDVTQITYPSGRVLYQTYNAVGQLCLISSTSGGCSSNTGYYAGNFSYSSPGKVTGFTYGNGVAASFGYSTSRTQLSTLKYAFGGSTYFSQNYWYQQDSTNCPSGTVANNGSMQCVTDGVDGGRTVNYSYDPLSRLLTAKTNGSSNYPQWGIAESYDRFGNRLSQTATAGTAPQASLSFGSNGINSTTTNQPNGYTYDASGNMTVEPLGLVNYYQYDGENRMTSFTNHSLSSSYKYDGTGQRVTLQNTGEAQPPPGGYPTYVEVYSGASLIAEYKLGTAASSPLDEYIYNDAAVGGANKLLAMIGGGSTTYYHQDDLSVRFGTNGSGSITFQQGSFPFGEQWYETGQGGGRWFFTSYDRDSGGGLDFALARYYDSRTGTFCSADPLAGSPDDPQSWNRYPYGRNDPIDVTDPSGKSWWSDLLIGVGVGAALFLAPEIESEIQSFFPTFAEGAGAPVDFVPHLVTGAFTASGAAGADVGASAGAGALSSAIAGGTISAAAGQATDQPRSQQRGQGPINPSAMINNAKNALSKNCDSAFKNKMPKYTKSGFFNSLASASISQYPAGTPNMPAHDLGVDATTAIYAPGRPISLWPNFYGNSAQYQMFTLVHEGIHHFTGWTDNQVFQKFHSSGLRHVNPGTGDITDWIKNGCPPAK